MPDPIADLPAPGCFLLHPEGGIEENQSVDPDRFLSRARVGAHTREDTPERDRRGHFAKGHSGNPKGRPRGIPNPKRRAITLQAWRANPETASAVAERRPWLLRPLLLQVMPPPLPPADPAERIGLRPEAVQTQEEARDVLVAVWQALSRGDLGTAEAARIARRVRARLRLQRRCSRIMQRAAAK